MCETKALLFVKIRIHSLLRKFLISFDDKFYHCAENRAGIRFDGVEKTVKNIKVARLNTKKSFRILINQTDKNLSAGHVVDDDILSLLL